LYSPPDKYGYKNKEVEIDMISSICMGNQKYIYILRSGNMSGRHHFVDLDVNESKI
jgi:hypothetical protein